VTDRVAGGKFAPGESGNPHGRPRREGDSFQVIIERNVTESDWNEIVKAAVRDSKGRGSSAQAARQWITDRMFGKVKEQISIEDVTGLVWDKDTPSKQ